MALNRTRLNHFLHHVFRLESLRPEQERVIQSVMDGQHTLAVMPTGAGKSLCYQLPALLLPGMTVVVSPLIALMKDQHDKLTGLGLAASQINSAIPADELEAGHDRIDKSQAEFIFTTPEQLANDGFLEKLAGKTIDLLVIDEAHCISQWGHDFRPAYLTLGGAIVRLGVPPVLALSATAPPKVIEDIHRRLGLKALTVIRAPLYRENLHFAVRPVTTDTDKRGVITLLVEEREGAGIVYVATIAHAEAVSQLLKARGIPAERYHGRVPAAERRETQDRFMAGDLRVIVATNAFGMGVDKADLRFVIHYDLPGSVDAYYQEAGRAGRDGAAADCVLLYRREDRAVHRFLMAGRYPTEEAFASIYDAVQRAAPNTVTLAQLKSELEHVAPTKIRVVLSALKEAGIIAERRGGRFVLKSSTAGPTIHELAAEYAAKAAGDREKLEQIVSYGQTAMCRWNRILEYFADPEPVERCGSCDNCQGRAILAEAAAGGARPSI